MYYLINIIIIMLIDTCRFFNHEFWLKGLKTELFLQFNRFYLCIINYKFCEYQANAMWKCISKQINIISFSMIFVNLYKNYSKKEIKYIDCILTDINYLFILLSIICNTYLNSDIIF